MNIEKIKEICADQDWTTEENSGRLSIEAYTPLGEDFSFDVEIDNAYQEIIQYAESFDSDEHTSMWIKNRGMFGVPSSIRDLLDDAIALKDMLLDLARALKKANDTQESNANAERYIVIREDYESGGKTSYLFKLVDNGDEYQPHWTTNKGNALVIKSSSIATGIADYLDDLLYYAQHQKGNIFAEEKEEN